MLTLSYGFKKPQDNDKGGTLFDALESNVQMVNDHTHNGTNSAQLAPTAVAVATQSITSGDWGALSGGYYSYSVTMTAGYTFDNVLIQCRLSTGDIIQPTIEKTGASAFDVKVNDNTLNVTVVYK